ncbi:hypothetical protein TNCT_446581 [Trichonephila clavata]|uniref:Uncharacterized protein n=1 Tax=Trichonephila clavata TaxID=2740835 RepID=A0A8X6GCX0_TRICU|nr:hypothetical protein TNCT_446581 [Trichonephila clavata]
MPKHKSDCMHSTPRRHSRGSPVAHRTRRQISFARAVQIGLCKICFHVLPDTQSLWDHLKSSHSPSAKQQHCLDAFPTEYHINSILSKDNAWEIFFGTPSCPKLKKCASPIHCSEPAPHSSEQSRDAVVERLPAFFSQPTAPVPKGPVVPPVPRRESPQTGCQTLEAVSAIPSGLSRSWCAPVKVYTEPFCQTGSPVHSKSLPLCLVSIQRDSPIWPPVSPIQLPNQVDLLEANLLFSDTTGVLSPSNENDIVPAVSAPEVLPLPTVSIICETPSPKGRSPPRSQSPNVLDIVLAGDISLPDSPDLVELKQVWPGKITGSPPHPAFPPPSYAAIVAKNTTSNRCPLFNCADWEKILHKAWPRLPYLLVQASCSKLCCSGNECPCCSRPKEDG